MMLEHMLEDDLTVFAMALYLAAILLEAWHARRHQLKRYRLGDTLASLSMLLASAVMELHPWIEAVFNTPSHHRVHHGANVRYLDRNHGGVLIIWDRLFGTFSEERDDEPVVYGLTTNIDYANSWTVLSHEYRAIGRSSSRH